MEKYNKLNKQPLKFVLAEFRFSPVLEMEEYIPSIQKKLRKQYPILEKVSQNKIKVNQGGAEISTIDGWSFVSADKKNSIGINQDRLVYCTADYPRFEGFAESCDQALKVLSESVEISLMLRIGLRYSDLILVDEDETISKLVNSNFTYPPYLADLGKGLHQKSEIFIETKLGNLAIRTLYGHHGLSCMPDITSLPVDIEQEDEPSERIILDFDHYWESKDQPVNFDVNDSLIMLNNLHEASREAFWKVTTDYARNEKWV